MTTHYDVTDKNNNNVSLKVLTYITGLTLTVILAIMSVLTFITAVVLNLSSR